MGAATFFNSIKGTDPNEAFKALTTQSQYEDGHQYSGGIGMKHSFDLAGTVDTLQEARELADRLIDQDDPRFCDKWGPAGCIVVRGQGFAFFGWASS